MSSLGNVYYPIPHYTAIIARGDGGDNLITRNTTGRASVAGTVEHYLSSSGQPQLQVRGPPPYISIWKESEDSNPRIFIRNVLVIGHSDLELQYLTS